jgi:hypothetical protein
MSYHDHEYCHDCLHEECICKCSCDTDEDHCSECGNCLACFGACGCNYSDDSYHERRQMGFTALD